MNHNYDCQIFHEYDDYFYYEESFMYEIKDNITAGNKKYEYHESLTNDNMSPSHLSPSPSYSFDSYCPPISINDLDSSMQYEIQWNVGHDSIPKCMYAEYYYKIKNIDPRNNYNTDYDLVFKYPDCDEVFTIHSDLIDVGIVEIREIR
jgi:hypothetical protein